MIPYSVAPTTSKTSAEYRGPLLAAGKRARARFGSVLSRWTSCSSARRHSARYCFVRDCERVRVNGRAATVLQGRPHGHEANPLLSPREGIVPNPPGDPESADRRDAVAPRGGAPTCGFARGEIRGASRRRSRSCLGAGAGSVPAPWCRAVSLT